MSRRSSAAQRLQRGPHAPAERAVPPSLKKVWVEGQSGESAAADQVVQKGEIEYEAAVLLPFVQRELLHFGRGMSQEQPIKLPKQVTRDVLALLLDYCRFHLAPGRSDKEKKAFDERFVRLDTRRLCELTSAADALDMRGLVDLTSRALARLIEGKTPEQIRAAFQLPDDLSEEEKLEPVRNAPDDPRFRLLNRLYAKKRKELQERRAMRERLGTPEGAPTPPSEPSPPPAETRSVEELLTFIEEDAKGGGEAAKAGKAKAKKRGKGGRRAAEANGGHPPEPSGDEATPDVCPSTPQREPLSPSQPLSPRGGDAEEEEEDEEDLDLSEEDEEEEDEEEEEEEGASCGAWAAQHEGLLAIPGPFKAITTLTSLAAFKPRASAPGGSGGACAAARGELPNGRMPGHLGPDTDALGAGELRALWAAGGNRDAAFVLLERLLRQTGLGAHCKLVPRPPVSRQGRESPRGPAEAGGAVRVRQRLPGGGALRLDLVLEEDE